MELTTKLSLKKPGLTDYVNVSDLNDNMDILDTEVGSFKDGSTSITDLETIDKTLKGAINEINTRVKTHEADNTKEHGVLSTLKTAEKTNLVGAINEALDKANQAFQSASDGKTVIASSITAKGVPASKEDTFPTLAGKINQIETDKTGDATATAADILAPETAYVRGKKVTGVIKDYNKSHKPTDRMAVASPNVHAYSYKVYSDLPGGDDTNPPKFHMLLRVPQGYYGPETFLGADVPGLEPSNIKKGVQISKNPPSNAGLVGAFTGEGTAPSSHVLIGSTFSNNTQMGVSGTMPDNGEFAKHITTQGGSYQIPQGYHNGAGYVKAQFNNLVASNIRKGVNVGGVTGDMNPLRRVTTKSGKDSNIFTVPGEVLSVSVVASTDSGYIDIDSGTSYARASADILSGGHVVDTLVGTIRSSYNSSTDTSTVTVSGGSSRGKNLYSVTYQS